MKLSTPAKQTCRSRQNHRREQGLMLLEAVTYVALLAVVLGLALGAFYVAFENNRNLTRNADDIARALRAGERWRADVRQASGAPHFVTNAAASQIELHVPQETNAVIYAYREGVMFRQAAGESNAAALLDRVQRSEFARDPRQHVVAWRWEVELETRQRVTRVRPLFTFQAAERTKVTP